MIRSARALLFDFDGTLAHQRPDTFCEVCAFCGEIGQPLSLDAERRGRRAQHRYFADPILRELLDTLSPEQFWGRFNRALLESMGIAGPLDLLAGQLAERVAALEQTYVCAEEACRTLAELRRREYALGLVTNRAGAQRLHELLVELGLAPYFNQVVVSGEVGVRKPDPAIFQLAVRQMGVRPHEALYVGDNYWADALGAHAAGVRPVLLDPLRLFPEANCLVLERIDELLECLP